MRNFILWLALFVIFILLSCSSITVKTDYDPEVDFSRFKSYHWANEENTAIAKNPLLQKRIINAVDRELEIKGFRLDESEDVDFIVAIHGGVEEKMNVTRWIGGYQYGPWWGPYGGRVDVSYYEEGTLVIDIIDAQENELAWRGLGTRILRDYSNPEELQNAVNDDVGKILASFPPKMK